MQASAASGFGSAPGTFPAATGGNHYSPSGISASSPTAPAEQAEDFAGARKRKPGFLTIREAAHVLRVSESTIRNAVGSGRLRAFRFGNRGGSIRIAQADLDDYITGAATAPLVARTSAPTGGQFKHLNASKLLAAWRQQGVLGKQQEKSAGPAPDTNSL
jgi:excisionase family DNA binding protein